MIEPRLDLWIQLHFYLQYQPFQKDDLKNINEKNPTLTSHYQAGHAVWDTGASGQERDAHDVVWDVQRVTDYGDLNKSTGGK